jgi:RNA polymerase sigma factor (sigma-70 family)
MKKHEKNLTPEQQALVAEHLDLADRCVARVARINPSRPTEAEDDLLSRAYTALVLAAQSYDPSRGVPFPGYAYQRVMGAVLKGLRRPGLSHDRRSQLEREVGVLEAQGGHTTTVGALRHELHGAPAIENVEHVSQILCPDRSPATEVLGHDLVRRAMELLLQELTEVQKRVFQLRFVDGLAQAEVASIMGVSQERISELDRKIRARWRAILDVLESE